jgi:uncharacterized membrane-anchored protein YhcB (DUF1043 family)
MAEKIKIWLQIAWKYILLVVMIAVGILATVLMVRFMSNKADDKIKEKIEGLTDDIQKHKDNLRDIDKYLDKHGVR